jgi:hypothetical protein
MQQNTAHLDLIYTTIKSLHARLPVTLLEKQVYLAVGGDHSNSEEYDTNLLKELKATNDALNLEKMNADENQMRPKVIIMNAPTDADELLNEMLGGSIPAIRVMTRVPNDMYLVGVIAADIETYGQNKFVIKYAKFSDMRSKASRLRQPDPVTSVLCMNRRGAISELEKLIYPSPEVERRAWDAYSSKHNVQRGDGGAASD